MNYNKKHNVTREQGVYAYGAGIARAIRIYTLSLRAPGARAGAKRTLLIYHLEPICDIIKEVGDSVRFTINKISLLED